MATSVMKKQPLLVIVGPTASGKTGVSISLAKQHNGEIISADSRAIYRGMDVGTAKPTTEEREGVVHWGIDLVEPGEVFSAADFKRYALEKIDDIRSRGRLPILVGGTGLYVDAVIFDYQFGSQADLVKRRQLMDMKLEELHKYCEENNIKLPENTQNKRYVVRAIEQKGINTIRRAKPIDNCIVVGISTPREILRTRIERRSEQLFTNGVVEEAKMLGKKYGWNSEAMTGNIYPLVRQYIHKEITSEELKQKFIVSDWRLAKRQLTWLRRNDYIIWKSLGEVEEYVSQKLDERIKS